MKSLKDIIRSAASTSLYVAPAVLVSLLSVVPDADAAPRRVGSTHTSHGGVSTNMHSSNQSGMYASAQYYGDFFTHMGTFTGKENANGVTSGGIVSYKSSGDTSVSTTYDPDYKTDYMAGGGSIGYSLGYFRCELEVQYANVVVDDSSFKTKDDAKYLEIVRKNDDLSGELKSSNALYTTDKGAFSVTSEHYNAVMNLPSAGIMLSSNDHLAAKLKNEGMRFFAGFLNVGYDLKVPGFPVVPFVMGGVGLAQTKFLGDVEYGFAYQVKGGISFNFNNNFSIFAAYDYRATLSKEYKEVPLTTNIQAVPAGGFKNPGNPTGTPPVAPSGQIAPTAAVIASDGVTVENSFGVHGLTAGIRVSF